MWKHVVRNWTSLTNSSRPAFRQLLSHADHGVQQINPGQNQPKFLENEPRKNLFNTEIDNLTVNCSNTRKHTKRSQSQNVRHEKSQQARVDAFVSRDTSHAIYGQVCMGELNAVLR